MTTNDQFRADNTRDYSAADLRILNDRYTAWLSSNEDADDDARARASERILREFDREFGNDASRRMIRVEVEVMFIGERVRTDVRHVRGVAGLVRLRDEYCRCDNGWGAHLRISGESLATLGGYESRCGSHYVPAPMDRNGQGVEPVEVVVRDVAR